MKKLVLLAALATALLVTGCIQNQPAKTIIIEKECPEKACTTTTLDQKPIARNQTIYGSGFQISSCEQINEKDIYELCNRIRERDPEEFEAILLTNHIHGHIGPNNVYGAKMALYAKKLLNGSKTEIQVISEAGHKPPISCLNDGISTAISATYGRGLIHSIYGSESLAANFYYKGKSVRLEVKEEIANITQNNIRQALRKHGGLTDEYFKEVRKAGLWVWENVSQEDLFEVTYPPQELVYCDYNTFNVNGYLNRLHNMIHKNPSQILLYDYLSREECIQNATISFYQGRINVTAVWKSNNQTVTFTH